MENTEKQNMTELAQIIIEDGQPLRAIYNYLMDTFDGIKNKELFAVEPFKDRIDFARYVGEVVCPVIVSSLSEWKLDEPEAYEQSNK